MYNSYPPFPAVLPMLFVEMTIFVMLLFVYWIDYRHSIGRMDYRQSIDRIDYRHSIGMIDYRHSIGRMT